MSQKPKPRFTVRLRTMLLIMNMTVLILPILGVTVFRFYENELVEKTETELIAQAAVIGAIYKELIVDQIKDRKNFGRAADPRNIITVDEYYTPVFPKATLSETRIRPPRPDGNETEDKPDPIAKKAGSKLVDILVEAQKTTLAGMLVLDYNGYVVASSKEQNLDYSHIFEVSRALEGAYESVIRERLSDNPQPALASISRGAYIRVFIAYPVIHEGRVLGVVYLSRTPQNILKHLYAERDTVILASSVLIIITLSLALLMSYAVVGPLQKLLRQTYRFATGEIKTIEPIEDPIISEIDKLSQGFSQMAQELQERGEYIRDFSMHVSHEFKTPLTSIQGAAELLSEHNDDMDNEKREKFLNNIMQDTERLKRLVNRLLELAKADNLEPGPETCSLDETLEKIQTRYKSSSFEATYDAVPDTMLPILMAPEYLETILANLIENSFQHGATAVHLSHQKRKRNMVLTLKDNGSGISEANAEKIFTPFFTTKRHDGGTGLGLKIVRSIIENHHGKIEIVPAEDGAVFKLTLILAV